MKICVIGDSHVAALKSAWDLIADRFPELKFTMFASRQRRLSSLEVSGDRLVSPNPSVARDLAFTSGLDHIPVTEFDAFLVYAMGLKIPILSTGHSMAVCRLCMASTVGSSLNLAVARQLRELSDKPIFLGLEPLLAAPRQPESSVAFRDYLTLFKLLAAEIDVANAILLPQPTSTMAANLRTIREYSSGSRRLDVGDAISGALHQTSDNSHMNADYGRIYLEAMLRHLGG